jgi:recombination protein RecR
MSELTKLIDSLGSLPGVGPKTATRLAYFLVKQDSSYTKNLAKSIEDISNIKRCSECHAYIASNQTICKTCISAKTPYQLCVVATNEDKEAIEAMRTYTGKFHILQGLIDPMSGVGPEQLNIKSLLERVSRFSSSEESQNDTATTIEVILALDASVEATSTKLYITKLLSSCNVKITKLIFGLSINSDIASADIRSLTEAFEGRQTIK